MSSLESLRSIKVSYRSIPLKPLQIKPSKLAYVLFGCALLLAIIVFSVNRFNFTSEVAIYAITMVVGKTQMRKCKVVVRQLSALEALGGVTHIKGP